jgi:hypothetical protein
LQAHRLIVVAGQRAELVVNAFGADAALGGPSGLALSVGLGRMELDFIVGLSMNLPDGGVLEPSFAAAAGMFFTVADSETTNFQL